MTQEDKELLLRDLSARLPYGVICYDEVQKEAGIFKQFEYEGFGRIHNGRGLRFVENIKPYLRPMSSMTREEKSEFINYAGYEVEESVNGRHYEYYLKDFVGTEEEPIANVDAIDWLNRNHFD